MERLPGSRAIVALRLRATTQRLAQPKECRLFAWLGNEIRPVADHNWTPRACLRDAPTTIPFSNGINRSRRGLLSSPMQDIWVSPHHLCSLAELHEATKLRVCQLLNPYSCCAAFVANGSHHRFSQFKASRIDAAFATVNSGTASVKNKNPRWRGPGGLLTNAVSRLFRF